jgi:hypothetical protein
MTIAPFVHKKRRALIDGKLSESFNPRSLRRDLKLECRQNNKAAGTNFLLRLLGKKPIAVVHIIMRERESLFLRRLKLVRQDAGQLE